MGQIISCIDVQFIINNYLLDIKYVINCRHICQKTMVKYLIILKGVYNRNLLSIFKCIEYTCTPETNNIHLINLPSLSSLKCKNNTTLNDLSIMNSIHITYLNCGLNNYISDLTLFRLKNLAYLNCGQNTNFTDDAISSLCNLKGLHTGLAFLTDEAIISLKKLEILIIGKNTILTDKALVNKSKLEYIDIGKNCQFNNDALPSSLRKISMRKNIINDDIFLKLINLEYLIIRSDAMYVNPNCLKSLTKLKYLDCGNMELTDDILMHLPNLEYLKTMSAFITDECIKKMPKLNKLCK